MAAEVAKTIAWYGKPESVMCVEVWCPGCEETHRFNVGEGHKVVWDWNGSLVVPTFDPSLGVHDYGDDGVFRPGYKCHSFLKDGSWRFLQDCKHGLAGQTVALLPVDRWPAEETEADG